MNRQYFTLKVPRAFVHNSQDLKIWLDAYFAKERRFDNGSWNMWEVHEIAGIPEKSTENYCYYNVVIDLFYLELN